MIYKSAHAVFKELTSVTGWWQFDDYDIIEAECNKSEYEYLYWQERLYVIHLKQNNSYWFVKAGSPGEALTKCLLGDFS